MKTKRTAAIIFSCILVLLTLTSCTKKEFDTNSSITVISREDGSGTRGAFVELFGIEEKDASGNKVDHTIETADITQSTGVMLTSISQNINAIGYISLGSLNDTVKTLKIDNVDATIENIKNGTYAISRPFNIVTKDNLSDAAQDFINFILSADGQKVVENNGYIAAKEGTAFQSSNSSGKITLAGSSSVTPVMEKLKEAYLLVNTNASVEINQSDSTTGVNSVTQGVCDIGMASRELKDSEKSSGVSATTIAIDGIAVIINQQNTINNLSKDQVKKIYTGGVTKWADVVTEELTAE